MFTLYNRDYSVIVGFLTDHWELDELNSATSANIIRISERHFTRYGIPDKLISDNAAVFSGSEFATFARTWEFHHTTSSPYYSRSNGKAESAVKIAKRVLTKCMSQKENPRKAILDWRNTPNEGLGTSPAQRLMSGRTQTMLPAEKTLLKPKIEKEVPKKLLENRLRSKQYYDRVSRLLPELSEGENVRVKVSGKSWTFDRIICKVAPRSYLIDVSGQIFRRNRSFVRSTAEVTTCGYNDGLCDDTPMPQRTDQNQQPPVNAQLTPRLRRSTRIRRAPDRLMYYR